MSLNERKHTSFDISLRERIEEKDEERKVSPRLSPRIQINKTEQATRNIIIKSHDCEIN